MAAFDDEDEDGFGGGRGGGSNLMYVIGSDGDHARRLVVDMLGGRESMASGGYEWEIKNKYYHAEVKIQVIEDHLAHLDALTQVHALLMMYSPTDNTSIARIKAIAEHLDTIDFRPEILLVVQSPVKEDNLSSADLLSWCNEEGLEHVVLTDKGHKQGKLPAKDVDEDEEDSDYPELQGIARICEALQSTIWPNISKPVDASPQQPLEQVVTEEKATEEGEDPLLFTPEINHNLEKLLLALATKEGAHEDDNDSPEVSVFTQKDASSDSFEQIFSLVQTLRTQGMSLPHRDRQRLAETITLAFAKSMVDDNSDDSDDD